ncbi:DUF924-domain-containing protein [Biscogniauxia mediterranea]|nr:DUF924-domain-containing protein [Biscogniauxia mediterranea]
MTQDIRRVVDFWFNRNPMKWIIAPEGFDAQCKSGFGDLVQKARQNELDDWATKPEGSLALVVLLDQLPRNIFRDSVDAFASDEKACEIAAKAIAQGFDKQVTVIQASAFYMPLMQQESLISLIAARGLFADLKSRAVSPEEHEWADMGIATSKGHIDQLTRFGRYPTRNAVLGRKSTEAEEEFLEEHQKHMAYAKE